MFDYHSLNPRIGDREIVMERLGMPHGMRMTWDYLLEYVQELQAK